MSAPSTLDAKITAIKCPCGKTVDQAFYVQHVNGDSEHGPHTLHVIEVKGVDPMLTMGKAPTPMLDIPYLGRVRRDGFFALCLIMLLLGVLLGARII